MDPRSEGVYCRWDEYPTGSNMFLLVIERVNGDGSVTTLSCTKREAAYIDEFLRETTAAFAPPLPSRISRVELNTSDPSQGDP